MRPQQKQKKQQGDGACCSILLKYLHPKQKIDKAIPPNAHIDKQELEQCVAVSQETRNIKRNTKVCVVLRHESFGENHIFCAEQYAKVNSFHVI